MAQFTAKDLEQAKNYSLSIIQQAQARKRSVFDYARKGKSFFDKESLWDGNQYVYAIDNVEYKLKELESFGSVNGKKVSKDSIYDELISVVKKSYADLFTAMYEYFQIVKDFNIR